MAYEKTIWKNREVERPRTYILQDNGDGTHTLVPAEGAIIEPGTPITAQVMQNIEDGIEALDQELASHLAETITDDAHGLYTRLGSLRMINFTLYSNSSVKLKFPSDGVFICLLLIQGNQANAYGAFVLQGYGIGGTRYKVGTIQKGDAISVSVDEEGESSFTVSNAATIDLNYCRIVMFVGSPPEII